MDLNVIRTAITLTAFLTFLGIVLWAYWPTRKSGLERRAILGDDE